MIKFQLNKVSQVKNLDVTPFYGAALGFHLRGDSRRMMMPLMIRWWMAMLVTVMRPKTASQQNDVQPEIFFSVVCSVRRKLKILLILDDFCGAKFDGTTFLFLISR